MDKNDSKHKLTSNNNTKITFDVRGFKYEVALSQLKNLPSSRIGKLKELLSDPKQSKSAEVLDQLCDDYDLKSNEFYFNRDPFIFKMILNFYIHGKLHVDDKSCVYLVEEELKYWEVSTSQLSKCCKEKFFTKKEALKEAIDNEKEIIEKYTHKENFGKYCLPELREKIWTALEFPSSTWYSRTYYTISVILLLFIISIQIVDTMKAVTTSLNSSSIRNIEYSVFAIFTIDIIVRFIICPNKLKFFIDPFNIVDFFSILPSYVFIILLNTTNKAILLKFDRMVKAIIILKLFRFIPSMRILLIALAKSWKELGIYLVYLLVGVLIFSGFIYYVEALQLSSSSLFFTIPGAMCMTTVGYGDLYPASEGGKVLGALCAISGIILLAMPVGLLSANFNEVYRLEELKVSIIERYEKNKVKKEKLTEVLIDNKKDE